MIREVESFGKTLLIEQDLHMVNREAGAMIWDSSFVLMKSFENMDRYPPGHFAGKTILELGSGTGVLSIVLLLLMDAGHVVLTDKQVLLPLMEHNIALNTSSCGGDDADGDDDDRLEIDNNKKSQCENDGLKDRYTVKELLWGETPIDQSFDHVIICDCVYESRDMWMPLAKCLQMVADVNPEVEILLCYELRSHKDAAFFPYITQFFSVTPIAEQDYHPDWYTPEIKIFTLRKHKDGEQRDRSMTISEIIAVPKSIKEQQDEDEDWRADVETEEEERSLGLKSEGVEADDFDTTTYAIPLI